MRDKENVLIKTIETCAAGVLTWPLSIVVDDIQTSPLLGLAGRRTTTVSYPTVAITPPEGRSAPHQRPRLEWRERLGNKK